MTSSQMSVSNALEFNYPDSLVKKIIQYYEEYYQSCGLQNYQQCAASRLQEDQRELQQLCKLEKVLSIQIAQFSKHLIIGLGTGGLCFALKQCRVKSLHGIEPNPIALEIAQTKADLVGYGRSVFENGIAEDLPYPDQSFDFIHCITVLEHVEDVEKALLEMYRVLKPNGMIYIHMPNYRFPREAHLKIPVPLFLGKTLSKVFVSLIRRPAKFLDHLNFVNERQINKILRKHQFDIYFRIFRKDNRITQQISAAKTLKAKLITAIYHFFYFKLDCYPDQELIIRKFDV
jgi:ubiquinone/menaquinone biosynthesis C-methylase UbiE